MVVRHARVREGTGHFERRKPDARPPGRKRQRVALTKSRLLDGRQPAKWSEITWIRYRSSSFCRSEEHTSELQSLMRISYAVFCLKKKNKTICRKIYNLHTYSTTQTNSITTHTSDK